MEVSQNGSATERPKTIYRGIKAMPFIIGNETFEKLGTTGTTANLLVYLTLVFNMKSITATTLVNIFTGTSNVATLIGALLCDTYFGRYNTLGFACVASFLGMTFLALTAAISGLHPPSCISYYHSGSCPQPTPWQLTFLICGLGLLVIGAGGIRPCNLAFGADQFDPNTPSGKRGINSFFNWYYFTYTFAVMVSFTGIVYVQSEISWAWGLAIPAALMFFSCLIFFVGSSIYVKVEPDGSPLSSVVKVLVSAFKKRHLKFQEQTRQPLFDHIRPNSINSILSSTNQFRWLDKAAVITAEDELNPDGSAANPWRLSSVQEVEAVKCLIRVIPIWTTGLVFYIAIAPQSTYVVFQALQSDRRLGNTGFKIPPASYVIFTMIAVTVWVPIYDRVVIPTLRRFTGNETGITLLQKMGFGMVIMTFTTLMSAFIEEKRRFLALRNPIGIEVGRGAISPFSGLWLIPQLTLTGLSEAFTSIAQIEFYYRQFPENMRSIGASLLFVCVAISSYLNGVLISVVHKLTKDDSNGDWLPEDLNKGRLDYFYYLVAALSFMNLLYFMACSKCFRYKESHPKESSDT